MSADDSVWDLAVVGAGPAGAAAALAALRARPRARVLLIDRDAFPRDKVCGDGVAPHALDLLGQLGAAGAAAGHRPVSRLQLRLPSGPAAERAMARPAHVVPRRVFDARLVAAAVGHGAHLARHRVRSVQHDGDRVVLDGSIAARVVVGADGAHSVLRRSVGLAPAADVAVALRGYAPVRAGAEEVQQIVLAPGGGLAYAWSFPIGDGRANVGYGELRRDGRPLSRSHLLERLEDLLPGAGALGADWAAHHLPLSSGRPRQPDGPVLLAGDALGLVNPLTGEGIYYAVLSGALAGRIAVGVPPGDAGRAHRRALARALLPHLWHTRAAARLGGSAAVLAAALRACAADQRVFDDLVELGLARGVVRPGTVAGLLRAAATPPGRRAATPPRPSG